MAGLAKKKKAAKRPVQAPGPAERQGASRPAGGAQGQRRAPQQPPTGRQSMQRASGGVPPPEAFDNLKRRPPPNLPGPGRPAAEPPPQQLGPTGQKGKTVRMPAPEPAAPPPKRKKPKKPVNPAKRRRRRRLAAVLALLVVIGVGVWLSFTLLFKIETFELEGDSRYTVDDVAAVFALAPGDSMFGFSAGSAQTRIETSLPYIETAKVRRKLPSTIVFEVTEAAEAYCLAWEDGYAVLSAQLKVLRTTDDAPENLMRIDGLSHLQVAPGHPLMLQESAHALDVSGQSGLSASTPVASSSSAASSGPGSSPPPSSESNSQSDSTPQGGEDPGANPDTAEGTQPDAGATADPPGDGQGTDDTTGDDSSQDASGGSSLPDSTPSSAPPPDPSPPPAVSQDPVSSFEAMELLLAALAEAELEEVAVMNVADPINLRILWQNRITVELGPKSGMAEKLEAAKVLLAGGQDLIGERDKGTLDMRYYLSTGQSYFKPT